MHVALLHCRLSVLCMPIVLRMFVLQSLESELLEIYSYYASLGQVQYVEEKLMMVHSQFLKMAKCTGLGHDTQVRVRDLSQRERRI